MQHSRALTSGICHAHGMCPHVPRSVGFRGPPLRPHNSHVGATLRLQGKQVKGGIGQPYEDTFDKERKER